MTWFLMFASMVFGLYFWREYRVQQRDLASPSSPVRTAERYIGQVLILEEDIRGGRGRARVGTRRWRLRGPDLAAGSRVRVTGVDGTVLIVDRLSS